MTPLETIIRDEIAKNGPMGIDRYMALCLGHPQYGYYMTRDPLGVAGDFTTAPEISQMFGELAGLWLAQNWHDMGSPKQFNLVELGPGRGTLMADILRAARAFPGFPDAVQVRLLETSPVLRKTQETTLANAAPLWIDSLAELADLPLLLVANEFFDALPVKQYQKIGDVWLERVIQDDNGLTIGLSKTQTTGFPIALPDGAIVERAGASIDMIKQISDIITRQGGAALIFDYGDAAGSGDTLQAVKEHKPTDLLKTPGEADLTAHVQFGDLARALGDCEGHLTTQGQFLSAMGIAERAESLARAAPDAAEAIKTALHRLTDKSEMGTLFKVMAITQNAAATPPGF